MATSQASLLHNGTLYPPHSPLFSKRFTLSSTPTLSSHTLPPSSLPLPSLSSHNHTMLTRCAPPVPEQFTDLIEEVQRSFDHLGTETEVDDGTIVAVESEERGRRRKGGSGIGYGVAAFLIMGAVPDWFPAKQSSTVLAELNMHRVVLHHPAAADTLSVPSSSPLFVVGAAAVESVQQGYSLASYYASLGLFIISVPGLWSLIKRSVKSKIVQKTFILMEQHQGEKKSTNQVAGEILSFFTRNNFAVADRGEVVTFEGIMVPSRGQAALLTFCTCISLASVALVLTIAVPNLGDNPFWLTLLSPLAGTYYWKKASRKEQIKVKMVVDDADNSLREVIVQGDDQQVEQLRKQLQLTEKGMVYVKGILER